MLLGLLFAARSPLPMVLHTVGHTSGFAEAAPGAAPEPGSEEVGRGPLTVRECPFSASGCWGRTGESKRLTLSTQVQHLNALQGVGVRAESSLLAILLPLENNPFKTSELSRLVIWPLIPESPERAAAGQSR